MSLLMPVAAPWISRTGVARPGATGLAVLKFSADGCVRPGGKADQRAIQDYCDGKVNDPAVRVSILAKLRLCGANALNIKDLFRIFVGRIGGLVRFRRPIAEVCVLR
jgi:hypothetical protein